MTKRYTPSEARLPGNPRVLLYAVHTETVRLRGLPGFQVARDVQHPARLVRLDSVTEKAAYLPSRQFGLPASLYW
jgi:hypothetical protein